MIENKAALKKHVNMLISFLNVLQLGYKLF